MQRYMVFELNRKERKEREDFFNTEAFLPKAFFTTERAENFIELPSFNRKERENF